MMPLGIDTTPTPAMTMKKHEEDPENASDDARDREDVTLQAEDVVDEGQRRDVLVELEEPEDPEHQE